MYDNTKYDNKHYNNAKNDENNIVNIFIEFIKDELLKSNIRYEIVKPILIYVLYYIIPFVLFIILLNFISTIFAICIVFKYLL
jgi:hypothetical protein